MIEVEIRSFIDEKTYEMLHKFLKEKAKFLDETFQITVYFNAEIDLGSNRAKTFQSCGSKEEKFTIPLEKEIEVKFKSEDFQSYQNSKDAQLSH
jgi:hypothetical protein